MRSRCFILGGVLLASACSESSVRLVEPSADVDFHAAIAIPRDGTSSKGTPLLPIAQNLAIDVEDETDIYALGYRAEDLPLELVPVEQWGDNPVSIARGCELRLPPPVWAARSDGDAFESTDLHSPDLPELSVAWLERSCPSEDVLPLLVETACRSDYCEPDVVRSGCRIRATGNDCLFDEAVVVIDWLGRTCIESSGCEPSDDGSKEGVVAEMLCAPSGSDVADCPVRFVTPDPDPPFVVDRVSLRSTPPDFIPEEILGAGIRTKLLEVGYARGASVHAGRVYVISHALQSSDCQQFEGQETLIHVFDEDTLAPITTATAPPCLRRLQPIDDARLFGAFLDGAPAVGLFDLDGRIIERAEVEGFEAGRVSSLLEAQVSPSRQRALVAYGTRTEPEPRADQQFFVVQLPSLDISPGPVAHLPPSITSGGEFSDEDHFVIADSFADTLTIVDLRNGSTRVAGLPHQTSIQLSRPEVVSSLGIALVPIPADAIQMQVVGLEALDTSAAAPYGGKARPIDSVPWSANAPVQIVGMMGGEIPDLTAVVGFFDPVDRRFLAGSYEVGQGPITDLVGGSRGDVFGVLPWRAELIRLRPKAE